MILLKKSKVSDVLATNFEGLMYFGAGSQHSGGYHWQQQQNNHHQMTKQIKWQEVVVQNNYKYWGIVDAWLW